MKTKNERRLLITSLIVLISFYAKSQDTNSSNRNEIVAMEKNLQMESKLSNPKVKGKTRPSSVFYQKNSSNRIDGIQVPTSANSAEKRDVIFPNPAKDIVNINIANSDNSHPFSFDIFNSVGQQLMTSQLNNNTIDVSALAPGMYIVRLYNGKDTYIEKLTVAR